MARDSKLNGTIICAIEKCIRQHFGVDNVSLFGYGDVPALLQLALEHSTTGFRYADALTCEVVQEEMEGETELSEGRGKASATVGWSMLGSTTVKQVMEYIQNTPYLVGISLSVIKKFHFSIFIYRKLDRMGHVIFVSWYFRTLR